jgi:hypothetical protein
VHELAPPAPVQNFGLWFMNGGHDVDGDAVPDIYVNDFGVNRAHVFSGADGGLIWSLNGAGEGGGFGIGRLEADVSGDGRGDLILAAWASNAGAASAGKAFVYSGQTAAVLETFTHNVPGATFGFDANGMGDVNLDGSADYLITAAWDSNMRGKAYLIAGTIAPTDLDGDGVVGVVDLDGPGDAGAGLGMIVARPGAARIDLATSSGAAPLPPFQPAREGNKHQTLIAAGT